MRRFAFIAIIERRVESFLVTDPQISQAIRSLVARVNISAVAEKSKDAGPHIVRSGRDHTTSRIFVTTSTRKSLRPPIQRNSEPASRL